MTDPFEHADAAYVMGALDVEDAADFEAHLHACPACRARVDEARATVALLSTVSPVDFVEPDLVPVEPVPETLLPGLLRRARRERVRRTVFTAGIAAVVAAGLVLLAIVVWPSSNNAKGPAREAFVAVQPSPVTASAQLVSKAWGTEIDLRCKYDYEIDESHPYWLRVIDKKGGAHDAGSWSLIPGKTISFTGGTAVPRDQIAQVQITRPDGKAILKLTP